jgi:hypothetical protein
MHPILKNHGITTPEAATALASEMRKAARGEYGLFDMSVNGMGRYMTPAEVTAQYGTEKAEDGTIRKDATNQIGVVTGLGLLGVPLEVPAKLLTPFPTLLVNRIPRRSTGGASVTFRKITAVNSTNIWPSVAEAADSTTGRNSRIARNEANITFNYKSFEMEDMITPEAIFGSNSRITPGQDFQAEDFARLTLLLSTKVAEEKVMLGGNVSALGQVAGITKTGITQQPTTDGTLANATNYNIQVSALTLQGYLNASKGGAALGENAPAAATVIATTAGGNAGDESLTITWTPVRGAVAYNVFVKTGGAALWQQTVTTTYAVILAEGAGAVVNVGDLSANALDYDGVIAQCTKAAFGPGYYTALATTATGNATLTTDSKGGIAEFDTMFKSLYDTYKVGLDELFVNTSQKEEVDRITVGSAAPIYRIDATAGDLNITGSLGIRDVNNRYMGNKVPVTVHPFLPPGTILGVSYGLGPFYTQANVGENIVMFLGWDYRSITFGLAKRAIELGIDFNGALVVYAPFALASITNVG